MAKRPKKTIKKVQKKTKSPVPKIKDDEIKKTKIRVIGIGGGGGSIVSEIASRMKKASFVAANTDIQALKTLGKKISRFQFGENLTHGLGTGMSPELGSQAAQNEKERIKKLLENQDLCILVACLGGGTGSGATPLFAKISKNLGNLTYGIFTLPFKFEGDKKMEIAIDSLKKIKNHLNALTIIPNERVFQIIDKETPLKQALSIINKNLAESLGGLIETIYEPGLINIDFADFRTILEGKGRLTYLNTVEVSRKDDSVKDLTQQVLASPLYPYTIKGARGVLFNIAGEKNLSLSEVSQISKTISELANPEAKIIFGISQSKKYSNTIKTTLLATGCGLKLASAKPPKKKVKKRKVRKAPPKTKEKKIDEKVKNPPKAKTFRRTRKNTKFLAGKKANRISESKILKNKQIKVTPKSEEKPAVETEKPRALVLEANEGMVRKNALQVKQENEEAEREMLEREKFWETPAFLRRRTEKT